MTVIGEHVTPASKYVKAGTFAKWRMTYFDYVSEEINLIVVTQGYTRQLPEVPIIFNVPHCTKVETYTNVIRLWCLCNEGRVGLKGGCGKGHIRNNKTVHSAL